MDLNFSQTLPKTVEFANNYPEVVVAVVAVMAFISLVSFFVGRWTKRKADPSTEYAVAFHRGYTVGVNVGKAVKKAAEAA